MFNLLIGPLASIISDVIKRVLPSEKMPEADRTKIEAEMQLALMQADWQRFEKEIDDRISARVLAEKELDKGNALTNSLAALHRPIWSFVILIVFAWTIISPQFGMPAIALSDTHKDIMQTVIIFYFGGRSVEKVFSTIKAGK